MVEALALEPHPEGGFFRETFRSETQITTARGQRAAATAILFLVTDQRPSRFHRLTSDELWLHHGGAALEIVTLLPDGRVDRETLTRAERRADGGDADAATRRPRRRLAGGARFSPGEDGTGPLSPAS